jgi:hypothetical protein
MNRFWRWLERFAVAALESRPADHGETDPPLPRYEHRRVRANRAASGRAAS